MHHVARVTLGQAAGAARINASNPCSEYMFLDDSACNLASFNLLKFLTPGGQFDIPAYRHAIGEAYDWSCTSPRLRV